MIMQHFEDFSLISIFELFLVQGGFILAKNLWFNKWEWSLILIPTYLIGIITLLVLIKSVVEMVKELKEWNKKENQ